MVRKMNATKSLCSPCRNGVNKSGKKKKTRHEKDLVCKFQFSSSSSLLCTMFIRFLLMFVLDFKFRLSPIS